MNKLNTIKAPVETHLTAFKVFLKERLQSESRYVEGIIDYILEGGGKGVRPLLVMLSAGMAGGTIEKRTYVGAMLIEMLHKASLVHDDVVDEAAMRHNQQSVNNRWSSRIAVIAGDYILARSFSEGMLSGEYDIVEYITSSMSSLAEGELIQMDNSTNHGYSRERYLEIISLKTASLLGASAGVGALSVGASAEVVATTRRIGEVLGMAFQIKDDILDFAPTSQTGKPQCADLREGKITLPLITILERNDEEARRLILSRLDLIDEFPEELERLRDFVIAEGGLEEATDVMNDYLAEAHQLLDRFPASEYRRSMVALCDYIGERKL